MKMKISFWHGNTHYNYLWDNNECNLWEIITCIEEQYKQIKEIK